MVTLESSIRLGINATLVNAGDLQDAKSAIRYLYSKALPTGTASGKADKVFSDTRTLAASATEDLDLAGVLTDPLGVSLTFAKVKAILVVASAANSNAVQISPTDTNGFVGPFVDADALINISPGGVFFVTAPLAGWAVTPATGDKITLSNGGAGTPVTYDILIIGTSA